LTITVVRNHPRRRRRERHLAEQRGGRHLAPARIRLTEIVTNTVGGNLICHGNVPLPQIGDSEGERNAVGGNVIGECTRI
jgi:hypothetical protein